VGSGRYIPGAGSPGRAPGRTLTGRAVTGTHNSVFNCNPRTISTPDFELSEPASRSGSSFDLARGRLALSLRTMLRTL
jgi:hypothetical protein